MTFPVFRTLAMPFTPQQPGPFLTTIDYLIALLSRPVSSLGCSRSSPHPVPLLNTRQFSHRTVGNHKAPSTTLAYPLRLRGRFLYFIHPPSAGSFGHRSFTADYPFACLWIAGERASKSDASKPYET